MYSIMYKRKPGNWYEHTALGIKEFHGLCMYVQYLYDLPVMVEQGSTHSQERHHEIHREDMSQPLLTWVNNGRNTPEFWS